MTELRADPPPTPDAVVRPPVAPPPVPGQMTMAWRIMFGVGWSAALLAFAAVWKASEEIGISTWWLGPRSEPQPVFVRLIPSVLCIVMVLLAVSDVRRLPWFGIGGSIGVALIAVFDVSRSAGLALVELAIAVAVFLVSLASFAGVYRAGTPATNDTVDPTTDSEHAPSHGGTDSAG